MKRNYRNVGYPYIVIELSGQTFSLTLNHNDNRPDYFSSLKHTRYMNEANTAEISLIYVPQYNENPNTLEQAIINSKGYCTFQYGFQGDNSAVYAGQIYDYTVQVQDSSLSYSLKLVSSSVAYNYTEIKDESLSIKKGDLGSSSNELLDAMYYEEFKEFKEDNVSYDTYYVPLTTQPPDWDTYYKKYFVYDSENKTYTQITGDKAPTFVADKRVLTKLKTIVEKYMPSYTFDEKNSICNIEDVKEDISIGNSSPMLYLQTVARKLVDSEDPKKNKYKIVVNDVYDGTSAESNRGTIKLVRLGSDTATTNSLEYSFDWNNRDGDVLSWNPRYNGAYAIFDGNTTYFKKQKYITSLSESESGTAGYKFDNSSIVKSGYSAPNIANIVDGIITDVDEFNEKLEYEYLADLTVLGLGGDAGNLLKLAETHVIVNVYVNGMKHVSSGEYVVIGIEDNVSSEGFTTTLNLYRYKETSVDNNAGNQKEHTEDGYKLPPETVIYDNWDTEHKYPTYVRYDNWDTEHKYPIYYH